MLDMPTDRACEHDALQIAADLLKALRRVFVIYALDSLLDDRSEGRRLSSSPP